MRDNDSHTQPGVGRVRKGLLRLWVVWRALRTEDRMLALLRGAVFAGAAVWAGFAPMPASLRARCALLLGVFLGYGLALLWLVWRWPHRARAVYLGALAVDLVFLYCLFGETGGISSPFLPAAFLLTALAAFHYGPVVGVVAACAALSLALLSDTGSVAGQHWSAFLLLFIFVTLTAAYVGRLARREAQERRDIGRLHEELQIRAQEIEAAYQRCGEVQDHLVHSERLATIGRMSAEMAHQIRNPLSSISLNLELIEDQIGLLPDLSREEAGNLITAIHKEIDNLAAVTESYLRFAKLPPFLWEKADLNDIVQAIIVFARPQTEQRGITVSQRLDDRLPRVRIDRRQFKFAVMNVLTNALDAMSAGGRLRVKTQVNDGSVELIISDTGTGVAWEVMEKIFDPFFTTKQGGTGLGLPLARRIVESHGGRIALESIPRVGTTFTVSLPADGATKRSGGAADDGS